ncbi:MAG: hypothetical protein [Chaetfec virus UA24_144]|nr:MAG: hypothetical protein [Chaetfec virus UA24_144]
MVAASLNSFQGSYLLSPSFYILESSLVRDGNCLKEVFPFQWPAKRQGRQQRLQKVVRINSYL